MGSGFWLLRPLARRRSNRSYRGARNCPRRLSCRAVAELLKQQRREPDGGKLECPMIADRGLDRLQTLKADLRPHFIHSPSAAASNLVLRQNSVRRQVIDLAGLIQRKFRLDGHPPAPP